MAEQTHDQMRASGLMDPGESIASHPAAPGVGSLPNAREVIMGGFMGRSPEPAQGALQAPAGNAQQYISSHQAGDGNVVDQPGGNNLSNDDLLTAQIALKRGGASSDLISDLLARAPDQAVQLGHLLSQRQSGADAKINRQDTRISELEQILSGGQGGAGATAPTGDADTQTRNSKLDAAKKQFAEATGVEESEIGPALETLVQALQPAPQPQQASGSQAEEWAFASLVESARSELSRDHPELQTPAIYAEVEQRMPLHLQNYAHLGHHARVRAAMKDATTLVLSDLGVGVGAPHDMTRANGNGSQPPRSRGRGGPASGGGRSGKYSAAQSYLDRHGVRG